VIVWTDLFPKHKRPLGYLRLVKARYRYYVHYGLGKGLHLGLGLPHKKPGYQLVMRSWRNKYKGRRCFILGNGPSLARMDLSPLRDEITIGCNAVYKKFPEWGWHTNYLLFEDTEQTEIRGQEIHRVKGPIKLAATYNAYAFSADSDTLFFEARRADPYYWQHLHPQFSRDFEHIVYLASTVTYIGLQLAHHLGCDRVYVIGIDHTYSKLRQFFEPGKIKITEENYPLVQQCHFDKNYYKIGDVIGVPHTDLMEAGYRKAREEFERDGRKIYNAGVDSMLDTYERVDYAGLFPGRIMRKAPRPGALKVLYISHASTVSGAPISFLGLMRHFARHQDWDTRCLIRMRGKEIKHFDDVSPSKFYYQYLMPGAQIPDEPGRVRVLWTAIREKIQNTRGRTGVKAALRNFIHPAPGLEKQQAEWQRKIHDEIRAWKPDVIYSNTSLNGDIIRDLDLPGVPVFVHVRELATTFSLLSDFQIHEFKTRPVHYFAVSNAVKDYLVNEQDIPAEKITIAADAIESDLFTDLARTGTIDRGRCGFSREDIVIGGMGFVNARKGPDLFLEVARRVIAEVGDSHRVRFLWLGEGPDLRPLVERSKEWGIADKVKFAGLVDNPYPYINLFSFALMTSRDDPFPRVNLEGALFKKPIICFEPSGGSREFAADDCGIIVPGFDVDAMAREAVALVKDEARRKQLGENAYRKVTEHYDVRVVAPIVLERFEATLGRRLERDPQPAATAQGR
jgi:glycosyltransferase involved in cell wall biosynthesis